MSDDPSDPYDDEAIRQALGRDAKPPDFDPKDEFGEPDQGVRERDENGDLAAPMVCVLVFNGTDNGTGDFEGVVQSVISFAESSGLFHYAAFAAVLDRAEVVPGSPLDQALTGRAAN